MESFKKATNYSVESKRMQDRDFANRFVAFFIGYQDYTGDLDMFLNDKMGELNKMTPAQRDDIRISFDKAMKCCYEIFKKIHSVSDISGKIEGNRYPKRYMIR